MRHDFFAGRIFGEADVVELYVPREFRQHHRAGSFADFFVEHQECEHLGGGAQSLLE